MDWRNDLGADLDLSNDLGADLDLSNDLGSISPELSSEVEEYKCFKFDLVFPTLDILRFFFGGD